MTFRKGDRMVRAETGLEYTITDSAAGVYELSLSSLPVSVVQFDELSDTKQWRKSLA